MVLFTNTDSDPDPGMDAHPKNGYSNHKGSGFVLESESKFVQWDSVAVMFGVWILVGIKARVRQLLL